MAWVVIASNCIESSVTFLREASDAAMARSLNSAASLCRRPAACRYVRVCRAAGGEGAAEAAAEASGQIVFSWARADARGGDGSGGGDGSDGSRGAADDAVEASGLLAFCWAEGRGGVHGRDESDGVWIKTGRRVI